MFRDKKFRDKNFRAQTFEEIISSGIKKSLGIRILGIKFKEHQLLCSQFNFLNFNLHNLAAAIYLQNCNLLGFRYVTSTGSGLKSALQRTQGSKPNL
jgi:hypothetical protein